MAVQGERVAGGFILITSIDGIRYAVRHSAVAVVLDADECRDETIVQLHGGHVVQVPCSHDEVLAWFVYEWIDAGRRIGSRIALRLPVKPSG
jgi:hypothetical protein